MDIKTILTDSGALQSIARELGVESATVIDSAEALIPSLLAGIGQHAATHGPEALAGMVDGLGGGALIDQVVAPQPTPVAAGLALLDGIFGSSDTAGQLAAATPTGLDPGLMQKMMPMLMMVVGGFLAKQQNLMTAQLYPARELPGIPAKRSE